MPERVAASGGAPKRWDRVAAGVVGGALALAMAVPVELEMPSIYWAKTAMVCSILGGGFAALILVDRVRGWRRGVPLDAFMGGTVGLAALSLWWVAGGGAYEEAALALVVGLGLYAFGRWLGDEAVQGQRAVLGALAVLGAVEVGLMVSGVGYRLSPALGQTIGRTEVYRGFLALGSVYAFAVALTAGGRASRWGFGTVAGLTALGAALSGGRAALAAIAVGAAVAGALVWARRRGPGSAGRSRLRLVLAGMVLAALAGAGAYALTQPLDASAQARGVAYEVTWAMGTEAPVVGNGFGRFERDYMAALREHFAEPAHVERHALLVNFRDHADNEWLQVFAEFGLLGVVWLAVGLLLIGTTVARGLRSAGAAAVVPLAGVVAATAVLALVTSPMRFLPTAAWPVIALGVLAALDARRRATPTSDVAPLRTTGALAVLAAVLIGVGGLLTVGHGGTRRAMGMANSGRPADAAAALASVYPLMKWNPEYLTFYGDHLLLLNDRARGEELLTRATALGGRTDPYLSLAALYAADGRVDEAIAAYQTASQTLPHRVTPKYDLATYLAEVGRPAAAAAVARRALALPDKAVTPQAESMRAALRALVDTLAAPRPAAAPAVPTSFDGSPAGPRPGGP